MLQTLLTNEQALKLLTEKETAALLGVSVATLRRWRLFPGRGPKFRKLYGCVRYAVSDLHDFIEQAARISTASVA